MGAGGMFGRALADLCMTLSLEVVKKAILLYGYTSTPLRQVLLLRAPRTARPLNWLPVESMNTRTAFALPSTT